MKWHQAHTTWFFETFVVRPFLPDYKPFREEFGWLFNSYYNSLGEEAPEKHLRASFSRPSLDEVIAFRTHVDEAMEKLFGGPMHEEAVRRLRDAGESLARDVPQFLSSGDAVAVHRNTFSQLGIPQCEYRDL